MPQLGDISTSKEIDNKKRSRKWIWIACEICGKERWIELVKGKPRRTICHRCTHWKGGISYDKGYRQIWVEPDDFFSSMAKRKQYVAEHRLVMARSLGRCLQSWEAVHHRNGIRDDNRIENLSLVLNGIHSGKIKCPYCLKEFAIR